MTIGVVYSERAQLVAFVAALYPSSLERSDPTEGFEWVLYVDTPEGQCSWHIADQDLHLFPHVPRDAGRVWDQTDLTYARLARLARGSGLRAPTHLAVTVEMERLPDVGKCAVCGKRRVLLAMVAKANGALSTVVRGRCGDCAGLRA